MAGRLVDKSPPTVLVDANGVGYEIDVPRSTFCNLPRTGEAVVLLTHLVVREDAHLLYGFLTAGERQAFRQLLRISGAGPKVALAVLSGLSVDTELATAVATEDAARRHARAGHGKKTRRRTVTESRQFGNSVMGNPTVISKRLAVGGG